MANGANQKTGGAAAIAVSGLLVLGLGGLSFWLHGQAKKAEDLLARSKREYREMADRMKKPVEESKRRGSRAVERSAEGLDEAFLDRKRAQAQIPQPLFKLTPGRDKMAGWKETSFTVSLQGSKESPVARGPLVDFLAAVESERPSARVKNLTLSFAGDHFTSVTVTLSSFQREEPVPK
jgi:hypothetical protein